MGRVKKIFILLLMILFVMTVTVVTVDATGSASTSSIVQQQSLHPENNISDQNSSDPYGYLDNEHIPSKMINRS
jgi:hypothetical protein